MMMTNTAALYEGVMPVYIILIAVMAAGLLISLSIALASLHRVRKRLRELEKEERDDDGIKGE